MNDWWNVIKDEQTYRDVVATGLAWELFSSLPLDWKDAEVILKAMEEDDE